MRRSLDDLRLLIAAGTARLEDFDGHDPDAICALKASLPFLQRVHPGPVETLALDELPVELRAQVPDGAKVRRFIANAQVIDRMGDLLEAVPKHGGDGWLTDDFLNAGGPFMFAHETGGMFLPARMPLGKVIQATVKRRVEVQLRGKTLRVPALVEDVVLHNSERNELALLADELIEFGTLRAVSVGFIPLKNTTPTAIEDRDKVGLGAFGQRFSTMEQVELSLVPVPANAPSVMVGEKGGTERAMDAALRQLEEQGRAKKSVVADWRREFPLGPEDARERLESKLRGFAVVQFVCAEGVCEETRYEVVKRAVGGTLPEATDKFVVRPQGKGATTDGGHATTPSGPIAVPVMATTISTSLGTGNASPTISLLLDDVLPACRCNDYAGLVAELHKALDLDDESEASPAELVDQVRALRYGADLSAADRALSDDPVPTAFLAAVGRAYDSLGEVMATLNDILDEDVEALDAHPVTPSVPVDERLAALLRQIDEKLTRSPHGGDGGAPRVPEADSPGAREADTAELDARLRAAAARL